MTYTYSSSGEAAALLGGHAVQVDLSQSAAVKACVAEHGPFAIVVNTAAVSQPGECEKHPDVARCASQSCPAHRFSRPVSSRHCRAVNIPSALVGALQEQQRATGVAAFVIHISTDQVYDGSRALWTEDCVAEPVNVYGRTKLEAEALLAREWPNHTCLRSSIIYGPQPTVPVSRTLLLQWMVR